MMNASPALEPAARTRGLADLIGPSPTPTPAEEEPTMSRLLRTFLAAVFPLAILSAGLTWSSDDRESLAHLLGDLIRSVLERERLNSDGAWLFRSSEVTHKIVADLDAGRLTLAEAAAALRAERESRPAWFRVHWKPLPGESVEECYLRQLLWEAESRLERDPRREEILTRLRAEYDALRERAAIRYEEISPPPAGPERPALGELLH